MSAVTIEKNNACFEKKEITVFTKESLNLLTEFSEKSFFWLSFWAHILCGENKTRDPIPKITKAIASNVAWSKYIR
jgi:hypothetical protein